MNAVEEARWLRGDGMNAGRKRRGEGARVDGAPPPHIHPGHQIHHGRFSLIPSAATLNGCIGNCEIRDGESSTLSVPVSARG